MLQLISRRWSVALVAALGVGVPTGTQAAGFTWDRLFSADGAPEVHLRARYEDARGGSHTLEVWRTPERIRRDTDGKLTLLFERHSGREDRYRVIDRDRRRVFSVSRNNLYRIGSFPDASGLAILLARPAGTPPKVTALDRPAERTPAGTCDWYEAGDRRVCWSAKLRLPLVLAERNASGWHPVLTVEEVQRSHPPDATFAPDTSGYAALDVDREVNPAADD
jgi:hypothetical protein